MSERFERALFDTESPWVSKEDAISWASKNMDRHVSLAELDRLVRAGEVNAAVDSLEPLVNITDLKTYMSSRKYRREQLYKAKLGEDLHWHLSFDQYKEAATTKHVHRLHPYKGKYIPQLVEYFLDSHTDEFKKTVSFKPGDVVLDPFSGSGTTLVQANELGIHCVGVDVSKFNCSISNVKVSKVSIERLSELLQQVEWAIADCDSAKSAIASDIEISQYLKELNQEHFPKPEFPQRVRSGEINAREFSAKYLAQFKTRYHQVMGNTLRVESAADKSTFLSKWFPESIQAEFRAALHVIESAPESYEKELLKIVLSRTVRSARATKHDDLATLVQPNFEPYYCRKHYKICKPLVSLARWWRRYSKDTVRRLYQFDKLRTDTEQICLQGDSRELDILSRLKSENGKLASEVESKGIAGIVTSPPYVGLIDYHEQHAYSYELYNLERHDDQEIGPLSGGTSKRAIGDYVNAMVDVFLNCRSVLRDDFNLYVVVNDKFNLYPEIADRARLVCVNQFRRPVLNRAEGNKGFYSENIYHYRSSQVGHQ